MKKNNKSSVIAVGTEITSGQITNSNAAWISTQLKSKGLITDIHLSVPDHKELIIDAIQFCIDRTDLVFITGGLGPTSDDFTRDVVAQWSALPLAFDNESWNRIQEILSAKKVPIHSIQKKQCYFPKTSQILKNSIGTANGFYINNLNKNIFVLPGPPREIESIWSSYVDSWLSEYCKDIDPYITVSWDTTGKGESFIARIVEDLIVDSGLEIGYRVHLPYVEVKLSFYKSQEEHAKKYIERIGFALKDYLK